MVVHMEVGVGVHLAQEAHHRIMQIFTQIYVEEMVVCMVEEAALQKIME